jgi:TonB family protein
MPEVLTNTNQGSMYPVKRSAQRKGMGNLRQIKARLGPAGEAVVVDVSENGIGLELAMPLQPGSTLAVDFDLPESGGHVRVDGRVIWSNSGKRAGIRFERIPDLTSERLKRWVSLGRQPMKQTAAVAEGRTPVQTTAEVKNAPLEATEESLTLDRAVTQVLARAMAITKATGAAIAIGPPEAMVCRASAGNAPDVGVPINPSSGLTGYCVRNRATVRCDDTESDERVNAAACREMELRSALVVPVFSGRNADELKGILEVFSSRAQAFTPDHIAKLEKLTKILGVVAADLVPGAHTSKVETAPTIVAAANAEKVPAEITPELKTERGHLLRKIGDRSSVPQPNASAILPTASGKPNRSTESGNGSQRAVEPQGVGQVKPAALTAPVVTTQIAAKETAVKLAELTKPPVETPAAISTEEIKTSARKMLMAGDAEAGEAVVLSVPSFTVESFSFTERIRESLVAAGNQRTQIGKLLRVVGALVIALEIAAAVFLYTRWEKKRAALAAPLRAVQTLSTPVTPAAVSQVAAALTPEFPPATSVPKHKKQTLETNPDDGSDEVIVVNRNLEAGTSTATASRPAPHDSSVTTEPDLPAPAPIPGKADLASIRLPDDSPMKPSLAIRMSSGTIGGKLIKKVEPIYPETAKARRIQGEVLLSAHISTDGRVKAIHVLKGNPFLGAAATEALKQWRYEPMKLNGNPVEMDTNVTVQFRLPN